jgi:hypothetical protein
MGQESKTEQNNVGILCVMHSHWNEFAPPSLPLHTPSTHPPHTHTHTVSRDFCPTVFVVLHVKKLFSEEQKAPCSFAANESSGQAL